MEEGNHYDGRATIMDDMMKMAIQRAEADRNVPSVIVPEPLPRPESKEERLLGRYDFEGGGYITIAVSGSVETSAALDVVQAIIDLKRKELAAKVAANDNRPK